MADREQLKNEIDNLPDSVIEKIKDFILLQKNRLSLFEFEGANLHDMVATGMSSTDFWDNTEDDVWDTL